MPTPEPWAWWIAPSHSPSWPRRLWHRLTFRWHLRNWQDIGYIDDTGDDHDTA